jgi:hypothetical protein
MAHFPPTDDSSQGSTSYSRISDPEEEEEEEEEQELHTTDGVSSEEEEEEHHRLQSRSPTPAPPARKVARKTPAAPSRAKPKSKLQQVSAGVTRNIVRRQIAYRKAIRSSEEEEEEEEEEYDDEEDVMARRRRGGAGKRKGSKKVKFAAAAAPSKRTRARKSAAPKKHKKSATDKVQTKRITALQKSNATLKKQIDSIKSTMKTIKGLTGTK